MESSVPHGRVEGETRSRSRRDSVAEVVSDGTGECKSGTTLIVCPNMFGSRAAVASSRGIRD
ncbi:hypothetical protein BRD20_03710 [Halobacteriales archaeon SW_8_65_20]|nr:MAG: hypothetical protein BRD20_03710 [Halobacteriales archaeon SW_8_65_20]